MQLERNLQLDDVESSKAMRQYKLELRKKSKKKRSTGSKISVGDSHSPGFSALYCAL